MDWIRSFLASFHPVRDAYYVSVILQYRKFPYQKIYEEIVESPERQIQLFDDLFNPTNENNSHETFFSLRKLQKNLILAAKIFLEAEPVVYKGRFFSLKLDFTLYDIYEKNKELAMTMLRFGIAEQMGMVDDLAWFGRFLKVADKDHMHELFKLLLDRREMTPEIFGIFMGYCKWREQENLISNFFYSSSTLPSDELLMRCALLKSSLYALVSYVECKGLRMQSKLDELRDTAISRGDRQSISTLFYWKCYTRRDFDLKASEMLEYIELGRLSPVTTRYFINNAFYEGAGLDDWPFEHLQSHPPPISRQMSREDRLSKWLCSGDLTYKDVDAISPYDLYDTNAKVTINMRFTKPVEMENGRTVIRAAEYCVLNARAMLDAHRTDQQAREISGGDRRKIFVGILYALAEGQHLDFTNTELEMPESGDGWYWVKDVIRPDGYKNAAWEVLEYLTSVEVYGLVHRASPRQGVQDGRVKRVVDGIKGLFVN